MLNIDNYIWERLIINKHTKSYSWHDIDEFAKMYNLTFVKSKNGNMDYFEVPEKIMSDVFNNVNYKDGQGNKDTFWKEYSNFIKNELKEYKYPKYTPGLARGGYYRFYIRKSGSMSDDAYVLNVEFYFKDNKIKFKYKTEDQLMSTLKLIEFVLNFKYNK